MSQIVRKENLGDTSFGAPKDIKLLNTPWGYYQFLGVPRTATPDEIKMAYRRMASKLHPDSSPQEPRSREHFQNLNHIYSVLMDDGGNLGEKHSRRRHYDEVSSLDSYFDGFIEYRGDRTKKLSEIILINLRLERKQAEIEAELLEKFPEFADLKAVIDSDVQDSEKVRVMGRIHEMISELKGTPSETPQEFEKRFEKSRMERESNGRRFVQSFMDSPQDYFSKILDIFYVGDNEVVFDNNSYFGLRMGILHYEVRKNILELALGGNCLIFGFPKVHFKAPQAEVTISDPSVEGIFHVIKGNVRLNYKSSSYGNVIRARASRVDNIQGFIRHGDLYVPERFAVDGWQDRKPALDVAVQDGTVSLQLTSPDFGFSNKYLGYNSLENIISKKYLTEKKIY